MSFNFDEIISRQNTNSLKYDFAVERGMPEDLLPLWVADMDFRTPPAVVDALVAAAQHGIFGYSDAKDDYFRAVQNWLGKRLGWQVEKDWLIKAPGVVFAIANTVRALTNPGDAVIIQQPVYYPFELVVRDNGRRLVVNELLYTDGHYRIDFADFEAKIVANQVKLFILCNPHNPVGRVWTRSELEQLGEICLKHQVKVIADEIHADFIYPGFRHEVFANLRPELAAITVTCTAPSKTFNLAGLQVSNLFAANPEIRQAVNQEIHHSGYSQLNTLGLVACQAAYEHGAEWLDELIVYLQGNLSFMREFLLERLPEIRLVEPQGTYLAWLDCSGLGLSEAARQDLIVNRAKLWLDKGSMFGSGGENFERINYACPRATLEQALERLERAVRMGSL
ncbi:MAG: pyridoxal phosphate-dependent aminotransferase [Clostridia bacterium]|nr:pyridoxal phosphate-dependent aminotransferase [Clostridia bacterium]